MFDSKNTKGHYLHVEENMTFVLLNFEKHYGGLV